MHRFWWRFVFPNKALKRESGENPEQTRCCKLFERFANTQATVFTRSPLEGIERWGGKACKTGVSQKTCQNVILLFSKAFEE